MRRCEGDTRRRDAYIGRHLLPVYGKVFVRVAPLAEVWDNSIRIIISAVEVEVVATSAQRAGRVDGGASVSQQRQPALAGAVPSNYGAGIERKLSIEARLPIVVDVRGM